MALNQRLRRLRASSGLTQEQVSEKLDIKRSTYAKYETGENEPDAGTLARLAAIFETTTDFLIMGRRPGANDEQAEDIDPEFLEQWHRIQEKSKTAHIQGVLPRVAGRRLLKGHLDSYESMLDDIIKDNEQREKDK